MKSVRVGLFCILPLALAAASAVSAERSGRPNQGAHQPIAPWDFRNFADPEKFMDQFFGMDTEADRQVLEKTSISPSDERNFGQRVTQAFLTELRRNQTVVTSRGKDVEYLRRLIAVVATRMMHSDRYPSWQVYVVEADAIEAKCVPGGTLIFFRGLLDAAASEAALVGVIAHELSHLDHGHQLNTMRRLKIAEQSFSAGGQGDPRQFMRNGPMLMRAFMRPFRPEDETEADSDAVNWMLQLEYDPRELAGLLERMGRTQTRIPFMPSFLQSHPPTEGRIQAVMETYKRRVAEQPAAKLYVGRENLRRRVPRGDREFPE